MSSSSTSASGAAFHAFGAVFVISKAGPHARKEAVTKALDAAGIAHEFFDATMGAELSAQEIAEVYDEEAALRHKTGPRKLHVSNIGCCLSHRRVHEEILRRELSSAVVLEDDALPLAEKFSALVQGLAELPPDWDLLYLGLRGHRQAPRFFAAKLRLFVPFAHVLWPRKYRLNGAEAARLYLRPFSKHLFRAGFHQGTHAYAVSRKGAAMLEANFGRISAPADATIGTLVLEGKLNAFALCGDVFTTSGAGSQIRHTR